MREKCLEKYPYELSGGMRQRIMIAIALISHPKLLIADEPTTSLDVTIQAQILAEMKALRKKLKMAILLITHDLGIVADVADKIIVMYAGENCRRGYGQRDFLSSGSSIYKSPFKFRSTTGQRRKKKCFVP